MIMKRVSACTQVSVVSSPRIVLGMDVDHSNALHDIGLDLGKDYFPTADASQIRRVRVHL